MTDVGHTHTHTEFQLVDAEGDVFLFFNININITVVCSDMRKENLTTMRHQMQADLPFFTSLLGIRTLVSSPVEPEVATKVFSPFAFVSFARKCRVALHKVM